MDLISNKDIKKVLKIEFLGFLGSLISFLLLRFFLFSRINFMYKIFKKNSCLVFIAKCLEYLRVNYELEEQDLKRIPQIGPYIVISNHPLGAIDGLILLYLFKKKNPDFKIFANFLLQKIKPLSSSVFAVNPFDNQKKAFSNITGIRNAMSHIKEGKSIGIFPSGEVATKKSKKNKMPIDKEWDPTIMKFIQHSKIPIVPIYFHAKNSRWFYLVSKINSILQTAKLPSEVFSQYRRKIIIRIGKKISIKDQEAFSDINSYTDFLRSRTYLLSKSFERKKRLFKKKSIMYKSKKTIIDPIPVSLLLKEIKFLRKKNASLKTSGNYETFLSDAKDIPNILMEIGRLREITFRAVGEGTNKSFDIDNFDKSYLHLFIWDKHTKLIVGSYRLGIGECLFQQSGMKGFYINNLFVFDKDIQPMFKQTIEMGRAFITQEYQQQIKPLFLLWQGILKTIFLYPNHKFLIGNVSISNHFSNFSKSIMIDFMKSYYYDPFLAQYIQPKKEFKVKLNEEDRAFIFNNAKADLNKLGQFIEEIEPNNKLPIFIKKYIKQNARVIGFNQDPRFNNAIDGLMYLKIIDISKETLTYFS